MKYQLKKLLFSGLALVLAQSAYAVQPGKYYAAKGSVNLQCNIKAKRLSASRSDLYEDGAVMVLDAGALTLSVSPAFPTVRFVMNNRVGYGGYKYIDEGSTISGELMAKLQIDDAILLTGHASIEDRESDSKSNCEIAARFEGKA